ncbi:MAG: type II secretion system protein GspE [Candidatus Omnitrophota bacterium]|nr:MAG: type II secretion system protein GspE [Candidatus Omnitrophota bacterium]
MGSALKERLINLLLKNNLLSQRDLEKALTIQKEKGGRLDQILIENNFVKEKELIACLSEQLNIPLINLSHYKLTPSLLKIIPFNLIEKYKVIPISKIGNTLTVAMTNPLNIFLLDDLKLATGCEIKTVLTSSEEIAKAIEKYYKTREEKEDIEKVIEEAKEDIEIVKEREGEEDIEAVAEGNRQKSIIKMVDLIIAEALKSRASDIHLEPYQENMRVRYRIDGRLQEKIRIPKQIQPAILARLKIMSDLDITEHRLPQDGRFRIKMKDKDIDFRVSFLPISFGEKVVLRILDKESIKVGLENLGFSQYSFKRFEKGIKAPYGIILITGPTGSGKSTTLYSILNRLNTPERNIITIEDPVEYQLEGITQIPTQPEIGFDFAQGLRSLLRQNPDIIMIGEIRDQETADVAIKASLTGQLIFSTLHTNDTASAFTRLIDMNIEPYLLSSAVVMVVAQRLIRKICPECKEEERIPQAVLKRVGLQEGKFYKGKGCQMCNNTGYYGRSAILEVLLVDDKIREMVAKSSPAEKIKEYAISQGMRTLLQDGLEKVKQGETSLEEVLRVARD